MSVYISCKSWVDILWNWNVSGFKLCAWHFRENRKCVNTFPCDRIRREYPMVKWLDGLNRVLDDFKGSLTFILNYTNVCKCLCTHSDNLPYLYDCISKLSCLRGRMCLGLIPPEFPTGGFNFSESHVHCLQHSPGTWTKRGLLKTQ